MVGITLQAPKGALMGIDGTETRKQARESERVAGKLELAGQLIGDVEAAASQRESEPEYNKGGPSRSHQNRTSRS